MMSRRFYGTFLVLFGLYCHLFLASDVPLSVENGLSSPAPDVDIPEFTYDVIQLSVPKHIKMNDINDYHEIVLPAYSNTNIQLRNMSRNGKDVGFALIQLHAYEYNVTLSYNSTIINGTHLTGLNTGLILYEDGSLHAINTNPHEDIWVALVLMLYNKTAPLPGGCNLEFPVEVSPVMNLTLKESTIEVDTPPASPASTASPPKHECNEDHLIYESFYLSMPSYDFSQRTYFTYIRKLISYASAKVSGRVNNLLAPEASIKRFYDRQVGRGMVFVTVAIDPVNKGFAAYVPVHTYACHPFLNVVGCYEFNIPTRVIGFIVTIIMAAEIVMGFCPIFVKAFICGGVVGALGTIKLVKYFNIIENDGGFISLVVAGAVLCALIFLVISLFCPIAAIVVCNFLVGYMLCIVIYYGFYGNLFVHPYISIILVASTIIAGVLLSSVQAFLVANGVLFGATTLFYGVNVVFSARLHYSLRNVIQGMSNENYASVLSDSSPDMNEIMAFASFVIILSICIYLRTRCKLVDGNQRAPRALFRLPCLGDRGSTASIAILADDSFTYENVSHQPTITRWTSGDDDVFESPESNSRFWARLRNSRRQ